MRRVTLQELSSLPKVSAVYKVSTPEGKVIYVGQAQNLHDRWTKGHHKLSVILATYGMDVYIEWTEVPEWLLNRAEHMMVSFYQPKLNSKMPPIL